MDDRIRNLLEQLDTLDERLRHEYEALKERYSFSIVKGRITFLPKIREIHTRLKTPLWKYVIPTNIRHVLSIPFIYAMIVPLVLLDVFVTVYHAVAFSLYRIPKVRRSDYITFDRRFLGYLNILEKANCLYCSYANGLLAYAGEIAARTERYWCPIKAAQKPYTHHRWYKDFADYGNPDEWRERFNDPHAFSEIAQTPSNER